jgi:hypothetical protein
VNVRGRLLARGYGLASRMRLNGVSVARRTRLNPPCLRTSFSRGVPACAPRARSTSWSSERGSGSTAHTYSGRGASIIADCLSVPPCSKRSTKLGGAELGFGSLRSRQRRRGRLHARRPPPREIGTLAGAPINPRRATWASGLVSHSRRSLSAAGRARRGKGSLRTGPTSGVDTAAAVEPCWVGTPTEWMRQGADEQRGGGGRARARVRLRRSCSRRRPPLRRSAGL